MKEKQLFDKRQRDPDPAIWSLAREKELGELRNIYHASKRYTASSMGGWLLVVFGLAYLLYVILLILLLPLHPFLAWVLPGLLLMVIGRLMILPRRIYAHCHVYLYESGFLYEKGQVRQVFRWDQAIYSLLMLVLFAGNILAILLTSANQEPNNVFVRADGTVNGFLILLFLLFLLLTLPALTLLCGALFGATRAFLVTCLVEGATAGLWVLYASTQGIPAHLTFASPLVVVFVLSPLTAALVGFVYDRRRYAAWWKSFFALLLGSAFFVVVLLTSTALLGRPTSAPQETLTAFYLGLGCIGLPSIPLLALPIAGVEGVIHAVVASRREKQ